MKTCPVVHFEMPYKDGEKTAEFYKRAFGWQMSQMDEKMGNYILAGTTEVDEHMMPKKPGAINGGFYPASADDPSSMYPSVTIGVDDIKQSIEDVKKAGGNVLGEPVMIPGVGWYVKFYDPNKNCASMLEPTR
ncbi:glyoxalase [Candidatus Cerribacteria bacterium 'Amazon FNV 2010 28 9']|uniref:Glyoxalase n=1 Tax=Candidatus Cerribacteria bacterium 'Amazon FNV 2010 28 9' TaxID=2081795 RepID=A0A317JRM7_9BACT|nr:MAG: glyoxalase [Candidatus Cerribacteria bacterium 'Amazon FNV 2010 28 9']